MTFNVGDLVRPIEDIWQYSASSILSRNTTYRVYRVNDIGGIYIETLDGLAIDHPPPSNGGWNAAFFELYVPHNDKFSLEELI